MTKKDYTIIARAISDTRRYFIEARGELTDDQVRFGNVLLSRLMRDMALENPRFDAVKFETAAMPRI